MPWDPIFGMPGTDGIVNVLAVDGTSVFAGGTFTYAGNVQAHNIALWNGTRWSTLGSDNSNGVDGSVYAIVVLGDKVYVGGNFTSAGGVMATNLAVWNRTTKTWSEVGGGVSGGLFPYVGAIGLHGGDIYVGGRFAQVGDGLASNIASWDGSIWSRLDAGLNGEVSAIQVLGDDLYVGGQFTSAGTIPTNSIARWNISTGQWSALGEGIGGSDAHVLAIAASVDRIIVGGSFTKAGGITTPNVAVWKTTSEQWDSAGQGVSAPVLALHVDNDTIYAGGDQLQRWDGQVWTEYDGGVGGSDGTVRAITVLPNVGVYVGGSFGHAGKTRYIPPATFVDPTPAANIAMHDDSLWRPLNSGPNDVVYDVAWNDGYLYIDGSFLNSAGTTGHGQMRWNARDTLWESMLPANWYPLGRINITSHGIYLGTSLWDSLQRRVIEIPQLDGKGGQTMVLPTGDLLLAGIDGLYQWDGLQVSTLDTSKYGKTGVYAPAVLAVAAYNDDVYIGGFFDTIAEKPITSLARWNRTTKEWSSLNGNIDGQKYPVVYAIAIDKGGRVFVGGTFKRAGGTRTNNLAMYDPATETWSDLGGDADDSVTAILVDGENVYVGGKFTQIGDISANRIARWNNGHWYSLGRGIETDSSEATIYSMTMSPEKDLYIGGKFTRAGGHQSFNLARWRSSRASSTPPDVSQQVLPMRIEAWPTPVMENAELRLTLHKQRKVEIVVYDIQGTQRTIIFNGLLPAGETILQWDASALPTGMYVYQVESNGSRVSTKFQVVR